MKMSIKPLSPDDLLPQLEDHVVGIVNNLIAKNFNGVTASVEVSDIFRGMKVKRLMDMSSPDVAIDLKLIINVYRKNGWGVTHCPRDEDNGYLQFIREIG